MGNEAFMRELRATESDVLWHSRCRESYLDQFGSFYAEPNSVGSILMKVQGRSRAPLRTVNLLDEEEEEEEMQEPPPKVIMEEEEETFVRGGETEVQILGEEDANQKDVVTREEEVPLTSVEGAGEDAAAKSQGEPSARDGNEGSPRMAEGSVDPTTEARDKFWELGTPLISRCLAFQGPDIDPYLRYAIEVDVECMVQELGALMGLDSLSDGTSSRAATSSRPALPENVVSFDSEGMMLGRLLSLQIGFLYW